LAGQTVRKLLPNDRLNNQQDKDTEEEQVELLQANDTNDIHKDTKNLKLKCPIPKGSAMAKTFGINNQKNLKEIPPTKITIYHEFDNSLHYNHKVNVVLRNINAVIKLIFKNTKD
jgi:hypothetical protein